METKKCSKWGEVKPISEFYKQKSHKDGYQSSCKNCKNQLGKLYCKKNSEKIKEYRKKNLKNHMNYKKECIALLNSWYIKQHLIKYGWRKENITEEIIEEKRNII